MLDLQLFASILGALYASVFGTVMCFHFFATMLWLGLKCSTRGFPSYRGLIWFCTGLGGAFLEIGGQYHVRPSPWYHFNLRCMPHGFYEEIRVSEISMSVEGLRRCSQVHILFSCGSRLHTFDKVCKEHVKSSTFLLPFWEHCALPFWYSNVLPFLYHIAMAEIEVFHKGVPKLQGSNLVLHSWILWGDSCLWNFYVSWRPFWCCVHVHILSSCGSRLHTFDKVCKEHIIKSSTFCFHFGSTVGFHFWYRNVLPFLYHIAMADIEEFHKGVPELQGSNLV